MNTDRTVILKNVEKCYVGLRDTQGRTYSVPVKGQVRISAQSLQDILDWPGSKKIFNMGFIKVENISEEELFNMGLTEKEIEKYLIKTEKPVKEEIKKEIIEEEIIEEKPVEEKKEEIKPTPVKKSNAKKSKPKKSK